MSEANLRLERFTSSLDGLELPRDVMGNPSLSEATPLVMSDCRTSVAPEEPLRQQKPHSEADDVVVKDMNELMELNLRIYHLQTQAGIAPPTPGLCDDITSVTRSLLRKMEQAGESTRGSPHQHRYGEHQFPSHQSSGGPSHHQTRRLDTQIRRQAIGLSMYPEDSYDSVGGGVDAGVFLHILACYQRIFDLFKHVCLSIHTHIEDNTALQSSSAAQVVMGTELISHLSGRLSRGLHQLTSRMVAPTAASRSGAASSSPSCAPMRTAQFPILSVASTPVSSMWSSPDGRNSPVSSSETPSNTGSRSCGTRHNGSFFQDVASVIESMGKKQAALCAHIVVIKHSIQESDKI